MLTIGELAKLAGTTVRAVRHYHALGLLPEPERDHSGYRRYGAVAVIRLLRVRRMRELGLPLDRIAVLVDAAAPALDDALDALDAELAAQADRIAEQRQRLAELRASSHDPELPPPLARILAAAAAAGVPARAIRQEKEMLLLDLALHPERVDAVVADYEAMYARLYARPGYREIAHRFDALADSDPDDPAVEALAADLVVLVRAEIDLAADARDPVRPAAVQLFQDWSDSMPPAQRRLVERMAELVGPLLPADAADTAGG